MTCILNDHEIEMVVEALAGALQQIDGGDDAKRERIRALLRRLGTVQAEVENGSHARDERALGRGST